MRLFCFPYAGGGASIFHTWPDKLPTTVEVYAVHLPGRENRLTEPPFIQLTPLVQTLTEVLLPHLTKHGVISRALHSASACSPATMSGVQNWTRRRLACITYSRSWMETNEQRLVGEKSVVKHQLHSFVSKCIDGIQTRGLVGRKVPEHNPNRTGEHEGDYHDG